MQSLRFSLQPAVEDISITWDLPKGVSVTVLSPPITAIFQGQRSLFYAQLSGQVGAAPSQREILLWFDLPGDYYVTLTMRSVSDFNNLSEFRGSRGLCDGEVQPGRSSLSEPAPLQSHTCTGHWVKQVLGRQECFKYILTSQY